MPELIVFVVAFAARLAPVLASGGLGGNFGYDPGVYYAAADALTFGRLPYRDFVLLHPPGVVLALVPFAGLGRVTTDHAGFMTAQLGFMALGALGAVLVVRVARRIGLPRTPAIIGGLFYAVWLGSVNSEDVARLGPLGGVLLLGGLSAWFAARDSPGRRRYVLAGLALGAAASVKIWWTVPLAILLVAAVVSRERRRGAVPFALGAAAALLAVNGPFFAGAPSTMWHMVVTEQLGRPVRHSTILARVGGMTGLTQLDPTAGPALVLAAGGVLLAVLVSAWRVRAARLIVILVLAQAAVLFQAPPWYGFYADYLAAPIALSVAAAGAPLRAGWRSRARPLALLVPAACTLLAGLFTVDYTFSGAHAAILPWRGGVLVAAAQAQPCVMSNSPMGLILTDSLSRGLRAGCPNWIDVTGRSYGIGPGPGGPAEPHLDHTQWQQDLRAYLYSGQAVIFIAHSGSQPDHATLAALTRAGVLARVGPQVLYRAPARIGEPAAVSGPAR